MKRSILLLAPLLIACGRFFYQAPPPLPAYPQRTPGKGWRQILEELHSSAGGGVVVREIVKAIEDLVPNLPSLPVAERLAKIDGLLAQSREEGFDIENVNFLNELRELAADDVSLAASRDYLQWRLERPDPKSREIWANALEETRQQLGVAPAGLRPNWLVHVGYCLYRSGNYEDAQKVFEETVSEFPDHPRAEAALLMAGRCGLEEARPLAVEDRVERLRAVEKSFDDFLLRHSHGRFAADAHGWKAGSLALQGKNGEAIIEQIERLEAESSPHTLTSVLRECDALLPGLFAEQADRDGEFQGFYPVCRRIVDHPELMRLFVYRALDPAAGENLPPVYENYSADRSSLEWLQRRLVLPQAGARRALEDLAKCLAIQPLDHGADPTTLFALAASALRSSQPALALALVERSLIVKKSDDFLYLKALSLSALDRHADASIAYSEMVREFPSSPLIDVTAFERALEEVRGGEAGRGLLALFDLQDSTQYHGNPQPLFHLPAEIPQWIDVVAHFASLEELEAPLASAQGTPAHLAELRRIVRCRAFAIERFDLAYRYLDPNDEEQTGYDDSGWNSRPFSIDLSDQRSWRMSLADWDLHAAELANVYERLKDLPSGSENAAALHLQAAGLWKAQRGWLCMPVSFYRNFAQDQIEEQDSSRRGNALLLGLSPDRIARALDSFDELCHALRQEMAAADESSDPEIAAPALERANEAISRLSQFSRYRQVLAVQQGGALSTALVARLRSDFPARPETQRAVVWSFGPLLPYQPWAPGRMGFNRAAYAMWDAVSGSPRRGRPDDYEEWSGKSLPTPGLDALPPMIAPGRSSMEETRHTLSTYRIAFDQARPRLTGREVLLVSDELEDLLSIAASPQMTADLFQRYVAMRRNHMAPPDAAGEWLPFAPWLAYWDLVRPVSEGDYGSVTHNDDTRAAWDSYLQKFPDGPKTEAAMLRRLRLMVRETLHTPQVVRYAFPAAPLAEGYNRLTAPDEDAPPNRNANLEPCLPPDLPVLDSAIDNYSQSFSHGRYEKDFLMLRALVDDQAKRYPRALAALTEVLDDPSHPELRMDAALQFAELSMRLLDVNERSAVAKAFRQTPGSIAILKKLASGDTCVAQLLPFIPWLEEKP